MPRGPGPGFLRGSPRHLIEFWFLLLLWPITHQAYLQDLLSCQPQSEGEPLKAAEGTPKASWCCGHISVSKALFSAQLPDSILAPSFLSPFSPFFLNSLFFNNDFNNASSFQSSCLPHPLRDLSRQRCNPGFTELKRSTASGLGPQA